MLRNSANNGLLTAKLIKETAACSWNNIFFFNLTYLHVACFKDYLTSVALINLGDKSSKS